MMKEQRSFKLQILELNIKLQILELNTKHEASNSVTKHEASAKLLEYILSMIMFNTNSELRDENLMALIRRLVLK